MQRFYNIEFLRFLCALAVAIYHWGISFELMKMDSNETFSHVLNIIYDYGDKAVPVFFVISGLVFANVYLSKTQNETLYNFSIKRLARLYPLHILTLFLIQLKVSALPILFAYVVYLVKYVRKNTLYTFLNNNLLFIFLGFTWIIKSVIQTGCVVFPFSPLCFETLSWVDLNYIKTVQDISVAFSDSYVFNTGLNEWFKNYIENPINENVLYNFLLSFIIICFINIKNFKKIQNSELNLFLFSYLLIGSTYYIFFGPDLRYLMGFQIVLVSLIGVYMKKIVVTNKIIIIILLNGREI